MTDKDLYSTHLPVLESIIRITGKLKKSVEFGMGMYSTKFFIDNSEQCISIEMQSSDWYEKVTKEFKSENWTPILSLGPYSYSDIQLPDEISIAFIDGHGDSRPECVQMMMEKNVPIIVAHDTEQPSYGWDRIINKEYYKIDFKDDENWTTVWLLDDKIHNTLLRK